MWLWRRCPHDLLCAPETQEGPGRGIYEMCKEHFKKMNALQGFPVLLVASQMSARARTVPEQIQELGTQSRPPTWVTGTQSLEPSPATSQSHGGWDLELGVQLECQYSHMTRGHLMTHKRPTLRCVSPPGGPDLIDEKAFKAELKLLGVARDCASSHSISCPQELQASCPI